jgi:hypothetical protein
MKGMLTVSVFRIFPSIADRSVVEELLKEPME